MDRFRDQKILLIRKIARIIEIQQARILSPTDFDELYELDIDQLEDVRNHLLDCTPLKK